jgi:tRNA A37 threonylcarbamoyladenosine synthetase subunit TsaC/SUA5/YrdC
MSTYQFENKIHPKCRDNCNSQYTWMLWSKPLQTLIKLRWPGPVNLVLVEEWLFQP